MKICIIGGGGQVGEGIGALLKQRGLDPLFYRPPWVQIPGVPRRPKRSSERLLKLKLERTPNASIDSCTFRCNWAQDRDLASVDVFIFTLPSFLAEPIGNRLAPFLSQRVVINISDRFLGTYALSVAAANQHISYSPRLGIAFNSPPLLAYQPTRDLATRLYYHKPFVLMGCFPRSLAEEAKDLIVHLLGIPRPQIREVPSMLDLAFENINSIVHAVQDLENLKRGHYSKPGSLYSPALYTEAMVRKICKVASERDEIARRFISTSFRSLEAFDSSTFFDPTISTELPAGTARYRHHHRLLNTIPSPTWYSAHGYEDIGWSLVPMESLGHLLGLSMSTLSALIDSWNILMGVDYRRSGRTANSLRLTYNGAIRPNPRIWPWRFDIF